MVNDPRANILTYLTHVSQGLLAANMLKSDGVTPLTTHVMYETNEIPYIWLFNGLGNDALFTIGTPETSPDAIDWDASGVGYIHKVPVTISTCSSQTVDGNKARWQCDAELRRVVETYPIGSGSFRLLNKMGDDTQDMCGWTLYRIKYILTYQVNTS